MITLASLKFNTKNTHINDQMSINFVYLYRLSRIYKNINIYNLVHNTYVVLGYLHSGGRNVL
jgi:hypothetical protein